MDAKKSDLRVTLGFIGFIIVGCILLFLYTKWQSLESDKVRIIMEDEVSHYCSDEYKQSKGDSECVKATEALEYRNKVKSEASESLQYAN